MPGYGAFFALILTLALPTAAHADRAFKATIHETFAPAVCPAGTATGTFCAVATGSGQATGLRTIAETSLGMVNLAELSPATGCAPEVATTTLTAANGDRLFLSTTGTYCPIDPADAVDSGSYNVTGGTGRFAGAGGGGTYVTRANMGNGTSVTTMEGSLALRGHSAQGHNGDDSSDNGGD